MSSEARIVQLEIIIAEQDRTITELSDQLTEQWKTVEKMQRKLNSLAERFMALEEQGTADVPITKPPHW